MSVAQHAKPQSILAEIAAIEAEERRRCLSELSGLPPVFSPLVQPARYKGAWGGRGSGKSWAFADLLLSRATKRRTRAVCVREYQISLEQSVKRLLEDRIEEHQLGPKFRILDTRIEGPNNSLFIFQGMKGHTAESVKSLESYDIAWVEEAQAFSENSLKLLRPTIRNPDSELWFSWNPQQPTDPVDVLLRGNNKPRNAIVVGSTYEDNPYFPDVLVQEMEWDRARDPDIYAHIWLGDYERHSEARVFKNWKIEEFNTPHNAVFYQGGDWGYSIDPSVLIRCFIQGRTLFVEREVYKIGCEIDHLPDLFDQIPNARLWETTADSARPETISYLRRHGYPRIMPAIKGKDSVKEGVIFLQSYDIIVHPRCKHTIDELTSYCYKKDPLTGTVTPILQDKKNHVIDSLRYATEKLRLLVSKQTIPQGVGEEVSYWGELSTSRGMSLGALWH